jgi:hypothetical protein
MIQTQVFQQVTDLALRGDGRDGGRTVKRQRGAQTFQSFLDAIPRDANDVMKAR